MIEHFADAIAQFAPTDPIGEDMDDDAVTLQDSLTFVVQIDGKRQQPQNVSTKVFGMRGEFLIGEDDEDEDEDDDD